MNKIFITDRYFLSYYAYGPINGVDRLDVKKLTHYMIKPDMYFFVDVTPEVALDRIKKYRRVDLPEIGFSNKLSDREEENWSHYLITQNTVYQNYKETVEAFDGIISINGNQNPEDVFYQVISTICEKLKITNLL